MEQKTCIELKEINYALIRQSIINDELLKIFEEFKQSNKKLQEQIDELNESLDNILSTLKLQRYVNIKNQKQIDELNERLDTLTNGLIKT